MFFCRTNRIHVIATGAYCMSTRKDYVTYIEDALRHIPNTHTKAMFGEYAVYHNDVVVGLICNDTLFIKITDGTKALFDAHTDIAPPYPGAKGAFVVAEAVLEDSAHTAQIIQACSKDLLAKQTASKPKRKYPKKA